MKNSEAARTIHLLPYKEDSDFPIFLGEKLTSGPFEATLTKYWSNSLTTKGRIVFVLEEVEWIALTELILLFMWALRLRKLEKRVAVCLPFCGQLTQGTDDDKKLFRRKAVTSFLTRWQFSKKLNMTGIDIYGREQTSHSWTENDDPNYCKVLPISFFSKKDKDETKLISELKLEATVTKILKNNSCLDPIESRLFSDVIFYELSKNIYEHALDEDIEGILSIGMLKGYRYAEEEYGEWDNLFFKNLHNKPYLQIVIADHGNGIYSTLYKEYETDHHLNRAIYYKNGEKILSEPFVIRYALEKFSTRTKHKRLHFTNIPRGLAWVYDVVREYNGFLCIRSGQSRVGVSFLPEHNGIMSFNESQLADFGGTVVQIILPAYVSSVPTSSHFVSTPESYQRIIKQIFAIGDFWTGRDDSEENYDKMLGALEDTFKPLDRNDIVFLDFSGIHWEKNTLSNFIRKIMYLQGNALAIGININRPHFKIIDEVNKIFLSGDSLISDFDRKITPLIDVTNDILFLGCKNDFEQNLLNELFQVEEVDLQSFITEDDEEELKKDKIRFLKRNVHLIGTSKNKLRIMASFKSGGDLLIDAIENMIKQLIEQPPLGIIIRHEDHIFHLPSGKYSSVYIQLSHILQFGNWAVRFAYSLITKLGLHFIDCKNINFIVGGTASVAPLLEAIAEGIGLLDDEKILCIETYIDTPYHNDFDDIPKDANVLIVTDVISTGGLIEKMVEAVVVRGANPKAIAAIVDTRVSSDVEIKVKDRTVSIYSLYSEPIKKTTNKVALGFDGQGKLIEDGSGIIEIDRLTATPYYEIVPAVPPLIDPKEFFEKHIKESFTISNRHIESGGTHFCFYIDTKKIFQNEIIRSELISTVVERLSKQLPKKIPNEITILYAWGSNATYAMPHLIAEIKKKTKISKIISRSIFRSKSVNGWRFGTPDKSYENIIRDRVVLIFDDGSNSGDTLTQLIDYSCSFSPRLLFLYILISRLEPFYRKFFQKIYAYGSSTKNVSCTFFTSLDIPTYKPNSCPCCNRERDIKADIMETFSVLEPVRHYLDRELRRIQSVRIRNIRKEIDERQYISLSELSADPEDSERFREEITRLIIVREAMAKLESLVPTEKDRVSLKDMMLDKNNLRMLVRIIRDEPHLWQKLASQCPDVINMLIMCCIDSLINVNSQYDAFDMAAMDIIFVTGNHGKIKDRLDKVILKTQASTDLLNSFIYYIFKFLNDDEIIQLLKESKDISEKDKSNDIGRKRNTRVQLSTALHWAILNRAKKVGTKGDIKKAIVWLKDIYDADPHKSFISLWNTIKETSLHYRMGKWAERYKWWLQIERLREEFITNIQTLQTILKHITGIDPYLISVPDVINSFTEIEKNLHKLSTEGLTPVESRKSYELFRSNIEKLHQKIIAKESKIATIMRGFPTEAEPEITSIEVMLGQSIMDNNIGLKISSFPNKCIKIICHNELFHDVFTEWIRNMCKHASANTAVTANLIISLTDQSLELKLIHDGSIAAGETKGYGETMIAEIMTDLGGRFDPPQSNLSGRIESKLIFERW